jgi:hypothetical protein
LLKFKRFGGSRSIENLKVDALLEPEVDPIVRPEMAAFSAPDVDAFAAPEMDAFATSEVHAFAPPEMGAFAAPEVCFFDELFSCFRFRRFRGFCRFGIKLFHSWKWKQQLWRLHKVHLIFSSYSSSNDTPYSIPNFISFNLI